MKKFRIIFVFLVGLVLCPVAFAAGMEPFLLSPRLPGMSLTSLQERIGRMECERGLEDGVEDCFVALQFGAVVNKTRQSGDVFVFLRAREGRVGQMVINGPVEHLNNVFATLLRNYGAPQREGMQRVASSIAPCTDLSQWQRYGHSVVVRVCRGQPVGARDFVVNMLADWYVASAQPR